MKLSLLTFVAAVGIALADPAPIPEALAEAEAAPVAEALPAPLADPEPFADAEPEPIRGRTGFRRRGRGRRIGRVPGFRRRGRFNPRRRL